MTDVVYEPWRAGEYQRLTRDVFGIHWNAGRGLRISMTAQDKGLPGLRIDFAYPRALQAIDVGYRLADIPIGESLLYRSERSAYLARFRENAAGTMENFPLVHWMVVSCNLCVDVLSECEPSISLLAG